MPECEREKASVFKGKLWNGWKRTGEKVAVYIWEIIDGLTEGQRLAEGRTEGTNEKASNHR